MIFLLIPSCSSQPRYAVPQQSGPDVIIDTAALQPGGPAFFTYPAQRSNVNFFVLKMHSKVLSFLDACVNCYPRKLGYRFENGSVVCRACDVSYPVGRLEEGFGGCYPIPLAGRLENGKYLISRALLERHSVKF